MKLQASPPMKHPLQVNSAFTSRIFNEDISVLDGVKYLWWTLVQASSHYLNQCSPTVNWTIGNKLQRNWNQEVYVFIFKISEILLGPQCIERGLILLDRSCQPEYITVRCKNSILLVYIYIYYYICTQRHLKIYVRNHILSPMQKWTQQFVPLYIFSNSISISKK